MNFWECITCGYIYDPKTGDPEHGVPPGTAFEAVPDTWKCPICDAEKAAFQPVF